MSFKELVEKLNQIINEKHLDNPHTFDNKRDLKDWIENSIKEIIGKDMFYDYTSDDEEQDEKFKIITPYSAKQNYVQIRYLDDYVCSINYKYTITSHYTMWRTESDYGIKSVELEMRYDIEEDSTFEEAKEQIKKDIKQDEIDTLKYREKKHKEIEKFMNKHNITIDELLEGYDLFKYIDYEEHDRYEKDFNKGKEANWYKF